MAKNKRNSVQNANESERESESGSAVGTDRGSRIYVATLRTKESGVYESQPTGSGLPTHTASGRRYKLADVARMDSLTTLRLYHVLNGRAMNPHT